MLLFSNSSATSHVLNLNNLKIQFFSYKQANSYYIGQCRNEMFLISQKDFFLALGIELKALGQKVFFDTTRISPPVKHSM